MAKGKKDSNKGGWSWLTIEVGIGIAGVVVAVCAWLLPLSSGETKKEAGVVHGPTSQTVVAGHDGQQINGGSGNMQQGGTNNVQAVGAGTITVNNYASPKVHDITRDAKDRHEDLWAPATAPSEKKQ